MRAFSDRLLAMLGPGALEKASPRIVESFFIFGEKKKISIRLRTARTCGRELSGWERWCCAVTTVTIAKKGHRGRCVLWRLIE
jgi:hypothetical protein